MAQMDLENLAEGMTTAEALTLFDSLDPIPNEFMFGRWSGAEIPTGHPMDGLLIAIGWYGKRFKNENEVHPLVVGEGGKFSIVPLPILIRLSLNFPIFRKPFMRPSNVLVTKMIQTKKSEARLRMIDYRGKTSATMIYDRMPIHDHFRRLDDNTVMGLMDFKWTEEPYFFTLSREHSA